MADLRRLIVTALQMRGHATTVQDIERLAALPTWAVEGALSHPYMADTAYVVGRVNGQAFWALTAWKVRADEKVAVAGIAVGGSTHNGG